MSDMKLNKTTTAKPMEDKMAVLDWNEYRKQILSRVAETVLTTARSDIFG
jgi:hypothetical protein